MKIVSGIKYIHVYSVQIFDLIMPFLGQALFISVLICFLGWFVVVSQGLKNRADQEPDRTRDTEESSLDILSKQPALSPSLQSGVSSDFQGEKAEIEAFADRPMPEKETVDPSANPSEMLVALEDHSELAWIYDGEEIMAFRGQSTPAAKNTTTRIFRTDFKYPMVRVVEEQTAGVAMGKPRPVTRTVAMIADHLTVGVRENVDIERVSQLIESEGFEIRSLVNDSTILLEFPLSSDVDSFELALRTLEAYDGFFEFVEPDFLVHTHAMPVDAEALFSGMLWGLNNPGGGARKKGADIDAVAGWEHRSTAPQTIIAVIDTGVRYTHLELAPNMWTNPNETLNGIDSDGNGFIDDLFGIDAYDNNSDPMDVHGHGTHVAGIIGASGSVDEGLLGVVWDTQLMALRFLGPNGSGTTSDAIRCIDYAREHGARILNNSWGGRGRSRALERAIERCADEGVIFVTSAGNASNNIDLDPMYPAAYSIRNIVTVAATDARDRPAFFTSRGHRKVDVSAPGTSILSAGHFNDTSSWRLSGTSMAAPFVSGILGLLDAHFPDAPAHELINRLYRGVDPMETEYQTYSMTGGRVNLNQSLLTTTGAPPNNRYEDAYEVPGSTWAAWEVDMSGSSLQMNEPAGVPVGTTGSVWFTFTALNNNPVAISTRESEIPVQVQVFREAGLTPVATSGESSRLTFVPQQYNQYFIRLTHAGEGGLAVLEVRQPPVNDLKRDAIEVEGLFWSSTGENGGAGFAFDEFPMTDRYDIGRTVWWKWTAPRTGRFEVSTFGSTFDTVLAVMRGEPTPMEQTPTHVLFALDRSNHTANRNLGAWAGDVNQNHLENRILDAQIRGIEQTILEWRRQERPIEKIGILLFDETVEILDAGPDSPGTVLWTTLDADTTQNGMHDLIQQIRTVQGSENGARLQPVLQQARHAFTAANAPRPKLVVISPGRVDDLDMLESEMQLMDAQGIQVDAAGPFHWTDLEVLQLLNPYAGTFMYFWDLPVLLDGLVAFNDDAHWSMLWSLASFRAVEGKTYYFMVGGYRHDYGRIEISGRDPDFPYIDRHPEPLSVSIGERAVFEVQASGQEPLLYQWYLNGEPIQGAIRSSYALWSAQAGDLGEYHVVVRNAIASVTSDKVRLDVQETAPVMTFSPEDTAVIENQTLRLFSGAVGTEPITWQWYYEGTPIPDQTSAMLEIPEVTQADSGAYHVVASNEIGSTRSRTVSVEVTSDLLGEWQLRSGRRNTHLWGVAYGLGGYVAVGDQGTLQVTTDLRIWSDIPLNTTERLRSVASGPNAMIAVGSEGSVFRATSLHHWENLGQLLPEDLHRVVFVDGLFWVLGDNGTFMRSLTGDVWETVTLFTQNALRGLAHGRDGYVLVTNANEYLVSGDGVHWESFITENEHPSSTLPVQFRDVLHHRGRYYFVYQNGIVVRESASLPSVSFSFNASNQSWFAALRLQNSTILVRRTQDLALAYETGEAERVFLQSGIQAICAKGPYAVAVGHHGHIFRSRNGSDWESVFGAFAESDIHQIAFWRGQYFAAGRLGALFSSPDGQWWQTLRTDVVQHVNPLSTFRHVFLEHEDALWLLSPQGYHGVSEDGVTWEWFRGLELLRHIISDGSQFLYSDLRNIYTSPDMVNPGEPLLPLNNQREIASISYGSGLYVAMTREGFQNYAVWTSVNGTEWEQSQRTVNPGGMLVHQNGIFLGSDMMWSEDGETWAPAGVLSPVPTPANPLSFIVPTGPIMNWPHPSISYVWPTIPADIRLGYDVFNELPLETTDPGTLESQMHGQLSSVYLRYRINVIPTRDFVTLRLRTRYNDGLVVWMNNKVVAAANAAESATWDSVALSPRSPEETASEHMFDLTHMIPEITQIGTQTVVGFQVLNHDPTDGTLLFDFTLEGLRRLDLVNVFAGHDTFLGFNQEGTLFVSQNARDWVRFEPETGVLRTVTPDLTGFTGVNADGAVYRSGGEIRPGPRVYLREPLEDETTEIGESVFVRVDAQFPGGAMDRVDLYAGNTVIHTWTEPPFTYTWFPQTWGTYGLRAAAIDENDLRSVSEQVDITVTLNHPWQAETEEPYPQDVHRLEHINDTYFALSEKGVLYLSVDRANWQTVLLPTEETLLSMAASPDDVLVVGGSDGGIFLSYDQGLNWVLQQRFRNVSIREAVFAFGRFILLANGRIIGSSPDYLDWEIEQSFANNASFRLIQAGDALMAATPSSTWITEDGASWRIYSDLGTTVMTSIQDIAYLNGDFYATLLKRDHLSPNNPHRPVICRLVDGGGYVEIHEFPDYIARNIHQMPYANARLTFSESGKGLFSGFLTAVYESGEWEPCDSVSYVSSEHGRFTDVISRQITFIEDQMYLIDDRGRILTSSNGAVWQTLEEEIVNRWRHLAYEGGRYAALGRGGSLVSSTDLNEWTLHDLDTTVPLNGLTHGDGLTLVVGDHGTVFVTTDWDHWQRVTMPTTANLNQAAYHQGVFLIAGDNVLFRSADGFNWSEILWHDPDTTSPVRINTLQNVNGTWFLVGKFLKHALGVTLPDGGIYYISQDGGQTWSLGYDAVNASTSLRGVLFWEDKYTLIGNNGTHLISEDLELWSEWQTSPVFQNPHGSMLWNNKIYLVGSGGHLARFSKSGEVENLQNRTAPFGEYYLASSPPVSGPAGLLWADGLQRLQRSQDGRIWEKTMGGPEALTIRDSVPAEDGFYVLDDLNRIHHIRENGERETLYPGGFSMNRLRKVGGVLFGINTSGSMIVSQDQETWVTPEIPNYGYSTRVVDVTHNGIEFVMLASLGHSSTLRYHTLTSQEGLVWEETGKGEVLTASSFSQFFAIDGAYFLVNSTGVRRSTDLETWQHVVSPGISGQQALEKINGRYYHKGHYSSDGIDWWPTEGWTHGTSIVYSEGVYLAINRHNIRDTVSQEGLNWSEFQQSGNLTLVDAKPSGNGFLALSDTGRLYRLRLNDLAVTSVQFNQSTIASGESLSGGAVLSNLGRIALEETEVLSFEVWLSLTGVPYDHTAIRVYRGEWQGNLAPGEQAVLPLNFRLPFDLPAGNYHVFVSLDPEYEIQDYNRKNNLHVTHEPVLYLPEWSVDFVVEGGGSIRGSGMETNRFGHNQTESFVPVPQKGFVFDGWRNVDNPGLDSLTLTFDRNHLIEAEFAEAAVIRTRVQGRGDVEIQQPELYYKLGSSVTLIPVPAEGWRFASWSGDHSGTENPLTLTVSQDVMLRALFIPDGQSEFSEWIATRAPEGHRQPEVDGMNVGYPNLFSYLYGLNPDDPESRWPEIHNGLSGLELRFPVNLQASNTGFIVEYSRDLISWRPLDIVPEEESHSEERALLRYELGWPSGTKYFFRVLLFNAEP
jgi:subtilisin family serine protease/photosystem II stability/assembly factor-like uncharacterized protein